MGLKRPPQHRPDIEAIFVSALDSAWDRARIETEIREMGERGEEAEEHPVRRYFGGKTRYDLGVEDVRSYLTGPYWGFVLRRIRTADRARINDILAAGETHRFLFEAAIIGCSEVRGSGDFQIKMSGGQMTEKTADELYSVYRDEIGCDGRPRPNLLFELGGAAWNYSSPLSDAEKKR